MKISKCKFAQKQTQYLGFIVDGQGILPDPEKVKVIRAMLPPENVRQVRSFICMCSFYRRFIANFSEIAIPIIKLTKKFAKFEWTKECQIAFDFLKESLTTVPVLGYPDINKPYILYTDASDNCVGACLTQPCDESTQPGMTNEQPLYFLSHKLSHTQTKWPTIEKECYAIYYALQKLDHYLHNANFVIKTDHKPLISLLKSPMQNKKIQLWALSIAGYNAKIEYIEGKKNVCADLLSCMSGLDKEGIHDRTNGPIEDVDINNKTLEINAVNSNQIDTTLPGRYDIIQDPLTKEELKVNGFNIVKEQEKDKVLLDLKIRLQKGDASSADYSRHVVLDDILYYVTNVNDNPTLRTYIPYHIKNALIKQYHDDNGHMGVDKVFDSLRLKYYWPNMYKELYDYVTNCVPCQTRSLKRIQPPLQQTDIPPFPFAKIGLDLSGPYPKTLSGNKYIIGFVDWYSGWCEAFAVPDKTAENVAHLLIDEIIPRFGTPIEIVTDNDTENVNSVMKHTLETFKIKHITTSVGHPQSNAKVEHFHRTLHDVMSKKIEDNYETWDLHLNQVLAAIRFNISESTKFSPYYLLYNRDPILPLDNILKPRRRYLGEEPHKIGLQNQHKSFILVHNHLKRAKKRQNKYADRNAQYT